MVAIIRQPVSSESQWLLVWTSCQSRQSARHEYNGWQPVSKSCCSDSPRMPLSFSCCHWLPMDANSWQRLSMTAHRCQYLTAAFRWLSTAASIWQRLSMTAQRCQYLPSVTRTVNVWQWLAVSGSCWQCLAVAGSGWQWRTVAGSGCLWLTAAGSGWHAVAGMLWLAMAGYGWEWLGVASNGYP